MKAFKKAVEQVSPHSAKIASRFCAEHGTDKDVEGLLKTHYKTCRNTLGLKIELENSLKHGGAIHVSNLHIYLSLHLTIVSLYEYPIYEI